MDELSALPPESTSKASKRLSRARPVSLQQFQLNQGAGIGQGYGSQDGYTNPSPSTTRRGESPSLSVGGYEGQGAVGYGLDGQSVSVGNHQNHTENNHHPYHRAPDSPTIHAPTPRRHLLDTSASQHWLHTPPLSPSLSAISSRSRPVSPLAYTHHTAATSTAQSQNTSTNYYGPGYSYAGSSNERVLAYQQQQQLLQFPGLGQHQGSSSTSLSSSTSAFPASSSGAGMGPATLRKRLSTQSFSAGVGPGHSRSFSALLEHEQMVYQKQQRRGSGSSVQGSVRGFGGGSGVGGGVGVGVKEIEEPGMGRRWVRWMHKRGLRAWVVPAILGAGVLVRLGVGLGSYSGEGTPPMYGDYEAQRHWMELTVHLPMREWYTYDLQYWGLDYPPLTAYVSWICGMIAHSINPSWVALHASRGLESASSKLFMRLSVLALDVLVYLPSLLGFVGTWHAARSARTREVALLTLVLQPALLLVDFGHFQYNSAMLGLTLLAMNAFARGADLLGAVFFVLSLGFKQMALYYAPAVGSYLLAKCLYLGPKEGTRLFTSLALTTLLTFTLLFAPWLPPFTSLSLQPLLSGPIHRIFPFTRGLFEDKVANFWCASNVVLKWRKWAAQGALVRLSAGLTAVGFLPSVVGMGRAGWVLGRGGWFAKGGAKGEKGEDAAKEKEKAAVLSASEPPPFLPLLPYALLTSAMSFFLFSFQVHEKTILVPLLPMTLLLSGAPVDSPVYEWGVLANNVGVFSMWPLLKRDGLGVQYVALLALWNRVVGYHPMRLPKSFVQLLSTVVYVAALSLHPLELVANPPQRYPDLYPVLNVLISTPVFVLVWLWSIKCGVEVGWALGGWGGSNSSSRTLTRSGLQHGERKVSEDTAGVAAGSASVSASGGSEASAPGLVSYRQAGGRAVSLGYAQTKRRTARRGSSVLREGEEQE